MAVDAPLRLHRESVRPEWIDYNGHMNVAHYIAVADRATDAFFAMLGVGPDYVARCGKSVFAIDMRTVYLRELTVGSPVVVTTQLVDSDGKRVHIAHRLEHETERWTAACSEWIGIHVDLETRRSAPFPAAVQARLVAIGEAHGSLSRPSELQRGFGLDARAA